MSARGRLAVAALAFALAAPAGAQAQDAANLVRVSADGPQPLWVPDPEDIEVASDERAGAGDVAAQPPAAIAVAPASGVATDPERAAIAQWMARAMHEVGLPGELAVMAALVESGLRNLPFGDRDSVGFFQMRLGIWNRGAYEGYLARPELQLRWFADQALAVRAAARARGDASFGRDPATWGEWIADIERPFAGYRGRYALRLAEAQALLAAPAPPVAPFALGVAVDTQPVGVEGSPDELAQQVLADARIDLAPNARADLEAGRIDARLSAVLLEAAALAPLAISVFQTGHSYLTVNGNVSNHSFGRGADISIVGGAPVTPSNRSARAMALVLTELPQNIRPTEIGTPWALAGPEYFTDSGHQDHLHVGFDSPAPGTVQASEAAADAVAVAAKPKATRGPAPTEPRFDSSLDKRDDPAADRSEPRFKVGDGR